MTIIKNTFNFLLMLCVFMVTSSTTFAQKIKEEDYHLNGLDAPEHYTLERCIDESEFVFEGVVLKHEVVRGIEDTAKTYTMVYVLTSKVFKGNVADTIVYVAEGGLLWDEIQKDGLVPGKPYRAPEKNYSGIFFTNTDTTVLKNLLQQLTLLKVHQYPDYPNLRANYTVHITYGNLHEFVRTKDGWARAWAEVNQRFYEPIQKHIDKKFEKRTNFLSKPKKDSAVYWAAKNSFEISSFCPIWTI